MKLKNIKYIVMIFSIYLIQEGFAQHSVNLQIYNAINSQIKNAIGSAFHAGLTINVDSTLNKNLGNNIGVNDPYGTLKDCYIFVASSDSKGFVGVYKDNHILWHSDTLINSDGIEGIGYINTIDLENNGEVDILTEWTADATYGPQFLWIFGWDGNNGTLLNAIDDDGQSTLRSMSDMYAAFEPVDIDGNGSYEILAYWPDDSTQTVYSWNGELFGKWADTPPAPTNGFLPRNKIEVDMHAFVKDNGTDFYYEYVIANSPKSIQNIDQIVLNQHSDSIQSVSLRPGWGFFLGNSIIDWVINFDNNNYIQKGQTDSNFVFKTPALPIIDSYYIRGHNGNPMGFSGSEWYNDLLTNSVKGLTISAADPPSPFVALDFLDTLISYKHQCVFLGWLKDYKIKNRDFDDLLRNNNWHEKNNFGRNRSNYKYKLWQIDYTLFDHDWNMGITNVLDKRLEKARTALVRNDSINAKINLEIFAVEIDLLNFLSNKIAPGFQHPFISSEAYALLKYNAEYLIDQLPEKERRGRK